MGESDFIVETGTRIARIKINRPERRNAFNKAMWVELTRIIGQLETQPEVRVVVITGAGDKAFAAGADISEMVENYLPIADGKVVHPVEAATSGVETAEKVWLAMVNGYAIGGGCELAIACDLRIAADTAKLGITSAKLGICISRSNIRMLMELVGPSRAKDILFTGRLLSAQEALSIGLVDYVVPKKDLEDFTIALAQEIAQNAPLSILGSKKMINMVKGLQDARAEADGHFYSRLSFGSADFKEGVRAFLEKRKPEFIGR